MSKIILTADKTCDIGDELSKRYNVELVPLHVVYDGKSYDDSVDIQLEDIYNRFYKDGTLPSTAAGSVGEYLDLFQKYVDEGCEVIHISLGSKLSASYSNACLAAKQIGSGVYVVDSQNLSTASGLVAIQASERIAKGMEAKQIAEECSALASNCYASFVIDTLKFMAAGGRCSSAAALGANLLQIKPSIEVDNKNGGAMTVGKKYRGKFNQCVKEYVLDELARRKNIRPERIFITHSGSSDETVEVVKQAIESVMHFDEIFVTRASCTISSHCGPNTIGILFMAD